MAEKERPQQPVLTSEEAAEVIRDATRIQQGRSDGTLSRSDVLAMAKELGLSEEAVDKALAKRAERENARRQVRGRLRALAEHMISYVGVVGFLAVVDFMTGPGWWVQWVAIPWGFALFMHAMQAVIGLGKDDAPEQPGEKPANPQ